MNKQTQEDLIILMKSIKNFYTLSFTGHSCSKISDKYKKATMEWEKANNCYKGYMGLRLPENDYRAKKASMLNAKSFSEKLLSLKVNYIEREFIFKEEITKWNEGTVIDFLSRCRIARYADCHALALESALLLNHIKTNVQDNPYKNLNFRVVRDTKKGHTFLVGEDGEKAAFVFDAWENSVEEPTKLFAFIYQEIIKDYEVFTDLAEKKGKYHIDKVFTNFAEKKCKYQVNEMILNNYLFNRKYLLDID